MKEIYLAGGCFWGVEHLFKSINGVAKTTTGYASARDISNDLAVYQTVKSGTTGLRECVKVEYDPAKVSLKELLFVYFSVVETDTPGRQGGDIGDQYQAAIYMTDASDKAVIDECCAIEEAALPRGEFAVETDKLFCFYDAEEYHQKYLDNTPGGYCHISLQKMAVLWKLDLKSINYNKPAKEILEGYIKEMA